MRLITAFSHRGSYNLLFFPAEADLRQVLAHEGRPPKLEADGTFLDALHGLSSALATLHNFSACDFDLELIGCHHDLKPSNILVDKDKFLLADFGLSRIRRLSADSKTMFKGADSNYIAPECEFGEGQVFQRNLVGRKSDVWAFGCILIEVLTYMLLGAVGVKQFEEVRKARIRSWTLYQFHDGGKASSSVHTWIDDLEHIAHRRFAGVFDLVRSMLEINPSRRPDAAAVAAGLGFISGRSKYYSVIDRLGVVLSRSLSFSILAESERLKLWADIVGFNDLERGSSTFLEHCGNIAEFRDLSEAFSGLHLAMDLFELSKGRDSSFSPAFRHMRRYIDRLCDFLLRAQKEALNSTLEMRLLNLEDEESLWEMQSEFGDRSILPNFRLLALAKYLSNRSDTINTSSTISKFSVENVKVEEDFGVQASLGEIQHSESISPSRVLIEWLEYDLQWVGEVGRELLVRVERVAELLHRSPKPANFRCFDCLGYYHEPCRRSFGLVFELPLPAATTSEWYPPTTLNQLIRTLRSPESRPMLGHIFKLAHTLSSSVLAYHKARWLHKNLSSLNVAFCPGSVETAPAPVTEPYLIGFNHSRPDESNAFTHGHEHNPEQRDYSHPDYLEDESRFRYTYDYYSLGVVLLEIGIWRTLASLTASMGGEDQSPSSLRQFLLERYVPRLGSTVGEIYQSAVRRCLCSDFNLSQVRAGGEDESTVSILSSFREGVEVPLSRCRA